MVEMKKYLGITKIYVSLDLHSENKVSQPALVALRFDREEASNPQLYSFVR